MLSGQQYVAPRPEPAAPQPFVSPAQLPLPLCSLQPAISQDKPTAAGRCVLQQPCTLQTREPACLCLLHEVGLGPLCRNPPRKSQVASVPSAKGHWLVHHLPLLLLRRLLRRGLLLLSLLLRLLLRLLAASCCCCGSCCCRALCTSAATFCRAFCSRRRRCRRRLAPSSFLPLGCPLRRRLRLPLLLLGGARWRVVEISDEQLPAHFVLPHQDLHCPDISEAVGVECLARAVHLVGGRRSGTGAGWFAAQQAFWGRGAAGIMGCKEGSI